jgi:lipid-A-disaccharide synthase
LAKELVFPEFIQHAATPEAISEAAIRLLENREQQQQVRARLKDIVATLGAPGAVLRGAQAILEL